MEDRDSNKPFPTQQSAEMLLLRIVARVLNKRSQNGRRIFNQQKAKREILEQRLLLSRTDWKTGVMRPMTLAIEKRNFFTENTRCGLFMPSKTIYCHFNGPMDTPWAFLYKYSFVTSGLDSGGHHPSHHNPKRPPWPALLRHFGYE